MYKFKYIGILLILALFLGGCEKEIEIDLPDLEQKLVVEGHIEPGSPTYVILTKSSSFFDPQNNDRIKELFVRNANVTVSDGDLVVQLQEYCLDELPVFIRHMAFEALGISPAQASALNICAYISFSFQGEYGRSYSLNIEAEGQRLTAVTTIPSPVPFDSLWTITNPDFADSLVALWGQINEPDTPGNYYRYFTKVNSEPMFPGYFGSVVDDKFANGTSFKLVIDRGYSRTMDIDFSTYGLFNTGDTIIVKLSSIDKEHFKFWSTIENQLLSGGPFSSPTYIQSNINGGLGIWGGYGSAYDTIIVTK